MSSATGCFPSCIQEDFLNELLGLVGLLSPAERKDGCLIPGGGNVIPTPLKFLGSILFVEPRRNEIGAPAVVIERRL